MRYIYPRTLRSEKKEGKEMVQTPEEKFQCNVCGEHHSGVDSHTAACGGCHEEAGSYDLK